MVGRGRDPPGSVTRRTDRDYLLEAARSRQSIYVYSFMRIIRHLGFFLIDLLSDYKTDIHCCRKGPLILIKFPSLLLVRFRAARACLSVTVTVGCQVTVTGRAGGGVTVTGMDRTSDVAGPGPGAVAAGPGTVSRRPDWPSRPGAGYMVGRGRDPPGAVTRRTDRLRSERLFA